MSVTAFVVLGCLCFVAFGIIVNTPAFLLATPFLGFGIGFFIAAVGIRLLL